MTSPIGFVYDGVKDKPLRHEAMCVDTVPNQIHGRFFVGPWLADLQFLGPIHREVYSVYRWANTHLLWPSSRWRWVLGNHRPDSWGWRYCPGLPRCPEAPSPSVGELWTHQTWQRIRTLSLSLFLSGWMMLAEIIKLTQQWQLYKYSGKIIMTQFSFRSSNE